MIKAMLPSISLLSAFFIYSAVALGAPAKGEPNFEECLEERPHCEDAPKGLGTNDWCDDHPTDIITCPEGQAFYRNCRDKLMRDPKKYPLKKKFKECAMERCCHPELGLAIGDCYAYLCNGFRKELDDCLLAGYAKCPESGAVVPKD